MSTLPVLSVNVVSVLEKCWKSLHRCHRSQTPGTPDHISPVLFSERGSVPSRCLVLLCNGAATCDLCPAKVDTHRCQRTMSMLFRKCPTATCESRATLNAWLFVVTLGIPQNSSDCQRFRFCDVSEIPCDKANRKRACRLAPTLKWGGSVAWLCHSGTSE